MKKTFLRLTTVFALSVLFASCASESALVRNSNLLRINLREGAAYSVHTTTTQDITTHVAGRSIETHMKVAQTMKLKVLKRYKQDSLLIQASFRQMALNVSVKSFEISFNSDSSKNANNKFSKYFRKLKKNPLTLKITPRGKILAVQGLNRLIEAGKESFSTPAVTKMFSRLLNKKNLKSSFFSVGMYPKNPVKVGSRWNYTKTIAGRVPMTLHLTYTVKDIQPETIKLNVKGRFATAQDSVTIKGMTVPIQASGTQTGTYTIDRSTGLISSGTLNQSINVKMSMMGRTVTVETNGKTNISTQPVK